MIWCILLLPYRLNAKCSVDEHTASSDGCLSGLSPTGWRNCARQYHTMTGTGALQDSQAIADLVKEEQADIVCLQETKLKDSDVEACEMILKPTLPDYHFYWNNSIARKGYSGTAIISRCAGINQACLQLQAWHLARLAIQASCISIQLIKASTCPAADYCGLRFQIPAL